jgi:hypothetical protein
MKATAKGELSIKTGVNDETIVEFFPVNDTVWMDKNELCELFGVYLQGVNNTLDAIFKTEIFHVEDVCKYHRVVKGSRISYEITEVKMEVIIAMAFRVDTFYARRLREWFMGRALSAKKVVPSLLDYTLN